jgi:hypothetical protein
MGNNALNWFKENFNDKRLKSELSEMLNPSNSLRVRDEDIVNILKIFNDNTKGYMENNVLNWFRENFNDNRLESELLEARRKDIINVLKILNDNYPISDGGLPWLETDEDFERTADEIIEWEKCYNQEKKIEVTNDNTPCKNWNGPNPNGWACKIFCIHQSNCDGINCKENCDWYNHTGFFADDKKRTSKRKK